MGGFFPLGRCQRRGDDMRRPRGNDSLRARRALSRGVRALPRRSLRVNTARSNASELIAGDGTGVTHLELLALQLRLGGSLVDKVQQTAAQLPQKHNECKP